MKVRVLLFTVLLFVVYSCKKDVVPEPAIEEVEEEYYDQDYDKVDLTDKKWKDVDVYYTYHFTGTIDGKYPYDMYLKLFENEISGYYFYLNNGKFIDIKGTINSADQVEFTEELGNTFKGAFDYTNGTIKGEWTNVSSGDTLPFSMANPKGKGYEKKQYKVYMTISDYSDTTYEVSRLAVIDDDNSVYSLDVKSSYFYYKDRPNFQLYLEDYNFDGYLDISMFEFLPAYPPVKFQYWLYDEGTRQYEFDNIYNDIIYTSAPGTDFRKQLVYEYGEGRGGTEQVYKYDDGKLYLIYKEYIGTREIDDFFNPVTAYIKVDNGKVVNITEAEFFKVYGKNVFQFFESKYCYEL